MPFAPVTRLQRTDTSSNADVDELMSHQVDVARHEDADMARPKKKTHKPDPSPPSTSATSSPSSNSPTWKGAIAVTSSCLSLSPCFGVDLKADKMGLDELVAELKKSKKRGSRGSRGREFWAFNCMAVLPLMGKAKSQKLVREFLTVAKGLLAIFGGGSISRGIVTFGDGDVYENPKNWGKFGQFFDCYLRHYLAILECIETNFSEELKEARMVMESLFIAPNISTEALF